MVREFTDEQRRDKAAQYGLPELPEGTDELRYERAAESWWAHSVLDGWWWCDARSQPGNRAWKHALWGPPS